MIDLRDLTDKIMDAVDVHIGPYQVGLLLHGNNGEVDCGSGVCIELKSRFFVATAGHNLVGYSDDQIFIVTDRGPRNKHTPFVERSPLADEPSPTPDLGYIELAPEVASSLRKSFLPIDRLKPGRGHSEDLFYYLKGFPSELVPRQLALNREYQLQAMGFFIPSVDPSKCHLELDPDVAILLDYRESTIQLSTGDRIDSPNPHGLSGGGIWGLPRTISRDGLWTPDITELLGIETGWFRDSRLIVGVQIQHWIDAVSRDCFSVE
jgi:hypothetical protein